MKTKKEKKIARLVKKVTMEEGMELELSDFQISGTDASGVMTMADFEILDEDQKLREDYVLKPGFYKITDKSGLIPLEVTPERYFETESNAEIAKHFEVFVNKQDVYEKRGLPKKRSILLHSIPGAGKTSSIRNFLQKFKHRNDVAVLLAENGDWLNWELVSQMWLDKGRDNTKNQVNLAVLVIEDIGGTELSSRDTSVSSEMLNFLDGNSDVFKIPTLIIGTTNFINLLGSTLCDRPGRFDKIIEVLPPKDSEIKILAEEFLGRPIEKDEENAIFGKKFTPAYCKEIIIRHELYNITIAEAAKELEEQRKKSREQKHGNNKKNTGFGEW